LARAALLLANLAALAFFLLSFRHGISFGPHREDLDVYRLGGRVWLNGGDLYRQPVGPGGGLGLPFTYPPIAAILFSAVSLVPRLVAVTGLTLLTVVLLGLVLRIFLRRLPGSGATSLWWLAWLMPLVLFIEPVRSTLSLGQINIVLMVLVSLDCLTEAPHWPRGVLVGLAAAVKLTPAGFVLFFLLRRDWRAAGVAAVSFVAATSVGFLLAWHDSVRYWAVVIFQTSRTGPLAYAGNQSIQGVIARAGLDPQTMAGTVAWLGISAAVLVAAWCGMRKAFAAKQEAWALSLNAFAALLISPISWSHHWVWCVPALLTMAVLGQRHHSRLVLATVVSGVVIFAVAAQWWFPYGQNREFGWAVWQQAIGSSYVIFAGLVLTLAAFTRFHPARGVSAASLHEDDQLNDAAPAPLLVRTVVERAPTETRRRLPALPGISARPRSTPTA
jgi:alpha-1,2-mannosyltransferase